MKHIYCMIIVSLLRLLVCEGHVDSSLRALSVATPAERRCFTTTLELRQAVDAYLYDNSTGTDVAATYGWPIGTWCVDAVENFDGLFSRLRNRRSATFNEDLSEWNVARATSMKYMFLLARDFDQDLCAWGDLLNVSTTSFNLMFRGTSCTTKVAPYVDVVPAGPFCEYCFSQGTTSAPSGPTPSEVFPSVAPTIGQSREPPSTNPTPESTPNSPTPEPTPEPTPRSPTTYPTVVWSYSPTDISSQQPSAISSVAPSDILSRAPSKGPSVSPYPTYSPRPSVTPSVPMPSFQCFETPAELRNAVVAYLVDNSNDTDVARTYGWPIGTWCVGAIQRFTALFRHAFDFNEDIGDWNMSSATVMTGMFLNAARFNQPIDRWDVSNVNYMKYMFWGALDFNQPIGQWDVSSVQNMGAMFRSAVSFNQPIGNWNVSNIEDCSSVLEGAESFNQDLCAWGDQLQVAGTDDMFRGATSCPDQRDPDLSATPPGPFCHTCLSDPTDSPGRESGAPSESFSPSVVSSMEPTPTLSMTPSDTPGPTYTPLPSVVNSESPSTLPASFRCFETPTELRNAVAAYLVDNSTDTDVARTYGWPIGTWCVGAIENFRSLFRDVVDFNEDIGDWNVSSATSMSGMFYRAARFNQPIGRWDVSNVEDMIAMFSHSADFNQPIGEWDVSKVQSFAIMFRSATSFNANIDGWDISNAYSINRMFQGAVNFNQPIGSWNVSNINNCDDVLEGAESFNQDLCAWGDKLQEFGTDMFAGTSCPDQRDPILFTTPPGPFCHICE